MTRSLGDSVVESRLRFIGSALLMIGLTYLAVRFALTMLRIDGIGSPVWWPASGLATAILLRAPRRWWLALMPLFVIGYLLANLSFNNLTVALTYMVSSSFEVLVASLVLSVGTRNPTAGLYTPRDAWRFAAAMTAALAVNVAMLTVSAGIFPEDAGAYGFLTGYVVSHALGLIAFAPLFLPESIELRVPILRTVEFLVVLAAVGGLAYWAFLSGDRQASAFPVLLPVVWATLRLDPLRSTVVSVVASLLIAYGATAETGILAVIADPIRRDLTAQALVGTVVIATMVLVLTSRHRSDLAARVRDSEQAIQAALRDTRVGMYMMALGGTRRGEILRANDAFCELLGYPPDEIVGRHVQVLVRPRGAGDAVHRRGLDEWFAGFAAEDRGVFESETTFYAKDGTERWVEISAIRVVPSMSEPYTLVHVHDLTAREQARSQLEHAAHHDPLTGLANRSLLFAQLGAALADRRQSRSAVGLLYVDLDRFKAINDTHGHTVGDAVLVAVADRLTAAVRPDDLVARLGGDEFAVLCRAASDRAELEAVADRVQELVRAPLVINDGTVITARVSVGIATVGAAADDPAGPRTADELIRAADAAMYEMKRTVT